MCGILAIDKFIKKNFIVGCEQVKRDGVDAWLTDVKVPLPDGTFNDVNALIMEKGLVLLHLTENVIFTVPITNGMR